MSTFTLSVVEQGVTVEIGGTMRGTWELEGDTLTEEITRVTLVSAEANGQQIPVSQLPPEFAEAMTESIGSSEIVSLDERQLVVRTDGIITSCDRS